MAYERFHSLARGHVIRVCSHAFPVISDHHHKTGSHKSCHGRVEQMYGSPEMNSNLM